MGLLNFSNLFKKRRERKVLVIEGGGMSGIFLTGVLQSFTDQKYFPFKLIVGTSAGALSGCVYAAGQVHVARDAFFSDSLSEHLIQLKNIFNTEKHVLDLDWMIDFFLQGPEPLNVKTLRKACPVIITATHCPYDKPLEKKYFNSRKDDLASVLKATAAMPFVYRGFVEYKNCKLLDGGTLDPIPFYKALEMGYKDEDILVLATKPKGYRQKQESLLVRILIDKYYNDPGHRNIVNELNKHHIKYNMILDDMEHNHPNIEVIYPPEDFDVDRLTTDMKKIIEGFQQGVMAGNKYMNPERYAT